MKITILGAGSIIPNPGHYHKRSYSAILVEIGKEKLLFDIGPGTLTKMQSLGISTQLYPDYLFISHYHIDHCLDYIALVKSRHFNPKTCLVEKGKKISVFGPTGLKKWNKQLFKNISMWNYMSSALNYKDVTKLSEISNGVVITKKGWKVTCCPIEHYGGVAFRLDSNGKSFVYTGDMGYDERISRLGKNADLVAIECSFPDEKKLVGKHLEPIMIGKLAKIGNFKKLVLTHMYPINSGKEQNIIQTIKKISGSKVILAYDFKMIKL